MINYAQKGLLSATLLLFLAGSAAGLNCKNIPVVSLNGEGEVTISAQSMILTDFSCCGDNVLYEIMTAGSNWGSSVTLDCDQLGQWPLTMRVTDCYGNVSICFTGVAVQDNFGFCDNGCTGCCYPDVRVMPLVLSLSENNTVTVNARWFDDGSTSSCSAGALRFSFSQDVADTIVTLDCDWIGQFPIQLWVTDMAGNKLFCETFAILQYPGANCNDPVVCSPVPVIRNGLMVELGPDSKVCLSPEDFDLFSHLNACNAATDYTLSFGPDGQQLCFDCDELGQQPVLLMITDNLGNENKAETFVIIWDKAGYCDNPFNILPPNNNVCNATPVNLEGGDFSCDIAFFNSGATVETGEPVPPSGGCNEPGVWCDTSGAENTVWFTFMVPEIQTLAITTTGLNTQLALWSAPGCEAVNNGGATLVAANDDNPGSTDGGSILLAECLMPGETYFLQMDGSNGEQGFFDLSIQEVSGVCETNTIPANPEKVFVSVYPNPAGEFVRLDSWLPEGQTATWQLFSMLGNKITERQLAGGNRTETLSLPGTVSGICFYRVVIQGETVATGKLIVE